MTKLPNNSWNSNVGNKRKMSVAGLKRSIADFRSAGRRKSARSNNESFASSRRRNSASGTSNASMPTESSNASTGRNKHSRNRSGGKSNDSRRRKKKSACSSSWKWLADRLTRTGRRSRNA